MLRNSAEGLDCDIEISDFASNTEGWEFYQQCHRAGKRVDSILCDNQTPGISGFDFAEHVRGLEQRSERAELVPVGAQHDSGRTSAKDVRSIPIMLMSAAVTSASEQQIIERLSIDTTLRKPFDVAVLKTKVRSWVQRKRSENLSTSVKALIA